VQLQPDFRLVMLMEIFVAGTGCMNFFRTVVALIATGAVLAGNAMARDDGRYANSPLKQWFDSLRSGKGPCCSDADGSVVSDVDWESSNGHYRVRIEGEWVEVPDDAVITEPNRVGRTMVWPIRGYGGLTNPPFIPGAIK